MVLIEELRNRWTKLRTLLQQQGVKGAIYTAPTNLYWLCGRVVSGYFYIDTDGHTACFIRRPVGLDDPLYCYIRKPEDILSILLDRGWALPTSLALETQEIGVALYQRLAALGDFDLLADGTAIIRSARMVKSPYEIEQFRISAAKHTYIYRQIPAIYREGMRDFELSAELVRVMLQEGSLGLFRIFGNSMECFMGSILAGDNAGAPSAYDFALGGTGLSDSLPVGENGTLLTPGMAVMVDYAGNYTPYATDMSRVFSVGKLSDEAYRAHEVSLDIHRMFEQSAKPGVSCEYLYSQSLDIAQQAGYGDCFMGGIQKAGFVGHGIGLEINELPVLAPRITQPLEQGMVVALEPKFVIPAVGAVGNEDSYLVTADGVERLTLAPQEIINLRG